MSSKNIDIRKTGPQTGKTLQKVNNSQYYQPYSSPLANPSAIKYTGEGPTQSPLVETGSYWGSSTFDDNTATLADWTPEGLSDIRAENQPWYAKVGAGIAKGAVLAGTTFLDGTIGLVTGIATAAAENRWSGIWDNDFSKAMQSVNEEMEKVLPNYYTQEEQESPWYENIFTANFLGDKFLKNLGFSIGAIYSGKVWAAPLTFGGKLSQVIGLVSNSSKAPAMVTSTIGAGISALNEGRVEALNNSKDWYEAQKAQLDAIYTQRFQDIQDDISDPITYEGRMAKVQYEEALAKINEDRTKMGNADLLFNIPVLWGSNLIQFGKFYANGYKTARKTGNIVKRAGQYVADRSKGGAAWAAAKGALSEGTEEISQSAAQRIAGNYYETDVQNFYKAKIDPEAEQETLSWIKAFAQGINETVNDGSAWEEFFIGGLTGAMGIPSIRKKANGKYGLGLEGGAYNEIRDYNEARAREEEIANRMNERIQSKEYINYYQGLIRHNKYQQQMNDAADRGSEFDYKNAEHAQMIGDIILFDNAGKLNDLKTLINESLNTSDENLDSIIRNTTSRQEDDTLAGPYSQYAKLEDGQIVSNFGSDADKQYMINKLNQSREDMIQAVDDYVKFKDDIDIRTGERLTDEQLQELTWLKSQINNWEKRATSVASDVKQGMRSIIENLSTIRNAADRIRSAEESSAGLTETYKKADKNIRLLDKIINNLEEMTRVEDKTMAIYLATNPKYTKGVIDEIDNLPEEYMGQEDKVDIISKVKDIQKLGNAAKTYKTKLDEYLNNPQSMSEDREKATKQVAKETTKKASSAIAQRFNFDKPLGEIADTLEENMNDIESAGGFDAFIKTLPEDQAKKLRKARSLKKGIDGLKTLIEESDMSDIQKRIADQLIDEHGKEADGIQALGDSLNEALNEGKVAQAIAQALSKREEGVNDLEIQEAIEDIEAKMREFLDDNIVKVADAVNQAEKISNAKTDKELSDKALAQAQALEKAEQENEGPTSEDEPQEPAELREPKEPQEPQEPGEPGKTSGTPGTSTKPSDIVEQPKVTSKDVKKSNTETNKMATKQAGPIQNKGNAAAFSERPQLTQAYMHGYDMQTYYQYITEHPEAIPEGVDKEAYTKYIREVWNYLNEHGAFQYVSEELSTGDEIEFIIDEDLNKKAGTIVVLMRTTDSEGHSHIIGSLPTAIDMDSRTKYNGKPSKQTLAEKRPGVKALYDDIVKQYKEWKANKANKLDSKQNQPLVVKTSIVSNKGKQLKGSYVAENRDGVVDYKYTGAAKAKHNVKASSREEAEYLVGDDWNDDSNREEAIDFLLGNKKKEGYENGLSINRVIIRPDGTATIYLEEGVDIEGKPAKELAEKLGFINNNNTNNRTPLNIQISADGNLEVSYTRLKDNKVISGKYVREERDGIIDFKFEGQGAAKATVNASTREEAEEIVGDGWSDNANREEAIKDILNGDTKIDRIVLRKDSISIYVDGYTIEGKAAEKIAKELGLIGKQESQKGVTSIFISESKTKVETLKGGILPLSTKEYTVSDIFEGTGKTPIIAVVDENGTPSRFQGRELDNPLMEPETSIQGQVYIMIPTSTGKYLPALAYSTPLSQLNQEDWYIQQIIDKILSIPKNLRGLEGASHELYKLLRVPGLSVQIGRQSKRAWTSTNDLTEATHLRLSYSNPKNPDKPSVTVIPMVNGEMTKDNIWNAINGIIKAYPKITTSVDITKLGNSEEHQEYRRNISRYLHTNLVKGQAHAINDWFTYEPTVEEKRAKGKQKVDDIKKPKPADKGKGNKQKAQQTVSLGGRTFNVDGDNVEADDEKPVTEAEKQAVLNSLTERTNTEIESATTIDLSTDDNNDDNNDNNDAYEKGNVSLFARGQIDESLFTRRVEPSSRFFKGPRGKRLDVTRTADSITTSEQLEKDIAALKKMFPKLSEEGRIRLVNGLIKTVDEKDNPVTAYGMYVNGVLYISDQSPKGTAFHEAFHYIIDTLLTRKERDELFKEAVNRYGNKDILELEEMLSEDFRDYMNGREDFLHSNILTRWFRRLKHIINSIIGNKNAVDVLFYNIYMNRYYKRQENLKEKSTKFSKEVYTSEMEDIMKEAKENGTFMLAPNGKPTNLTERQWLQVRTKAFKEWFGDWERVAYSSKYRESQDIPNSITSATYQGITVSEATFDPDMAPDGGKRIIFLGDEYIGEIPVFETKDRIRMGGSIGTALEINEEYRGKGYGKKAHIALANIAKSEGKTLYSDNSNSDTEDNLWKSLVKEGIAEVVSEKPKTGNWNHTTYRIINDKLPQADDVNSGDRNVSKVVDENGEPKVMFHQTANQFTVFDTSRSEASSVDTATPFGIFLKPTSQNIGVRGDIQMPLFVSMKNPLRASNRAELEKTIRENSKEYARLQDEYSQKDEELSKRKNQARQDGDFELASQLRKESNKLEEEYAAKLKKEINKFLNDKKYDGIILEQDEGTSGETVSATIALDANQVKSATDNIGTFSTENDDIRFMRVNESDLENPEDFERELLRYKENKLSYANLDSETKEFLEQRKVSQEDYDNLSIEGKEDTLSCII